MEFHENEIRSHIEHIIRLSLNRRHAIVSAYFPKTIIDCAGEAWTYEVLELDERVKALGNLENAPWPTLVDELACRKPRKEYGGPENAPYSFYGLIERRIVLKQDMW